ncbi:hypothetical protein FPSE5266_10572 [Fusarium pseudograminearum]|nr:hypothetical protein FPSE5266_10572 [Fusarium pseudograminearum]
MAYYPMKMRSGCGICGTFMEAHLGFSPEDWLNDVFAIHGPRSPGPESPGPESSGPGESELLTCLPQEVLDEITDYFRCGTEPVGSQPTYLLPQHFWKQFIVKIPFLWDLEVRRFQQFTDWSVDSNMEWDWELLFRQLMERPVAVSTNDNTQEAKSFEFWDYRQTGLEAPPGLTNRRRIWQIFNDMDEGKTFVWRDGWLL